MRLFCAGRYIDSDAGSEPSLEKFVITGGQRLTGEVSVSGAKNAVVAILPATIDHAPRRNGRAARILGAVCKTRYRHAQCIIRLHQAVFGNRRRQRVACGGDCVFKLVRRLRAAKRYVDLLRACQRSGKTRFLRGNARIIFAKLCDIVRNDRSYPRSEAL